ncbi:hypothetical protein CEUSTIGMA_g11414.t1 [Chlamydomonas eustigma]|uniref:RNA polymerase II C-terminal domain phosphatase-like n=1 Tax=Chlamydomonas eustigma TaxID=1157962 RepID=A0A250XM33_9CHLO|nr:hypothetical protein CEUSTIGMA_g11414.t1 [Chlamydomonas eustigma]|eukprot:GAX83989.1 hypothetical protein CEUSTIGMA_g11414.t1 [Chlamydomonas eustigma]
MSETDFDEEFDNAFASEEQEDSGLCKEKSNGEETHNVESGTSDCTSDVDIDEFAEGLLQDSGRLVSMEGASAADFTEISDQTLTCERKDLSGHTSSSSRVRKRKHVGTGLMSDHAKVGSLEEVKEAVVTTDGHAIKAANPTSSLSHDSQGGCEHPTYWGGLCVVCGMPRPDTEITHFMDSHERQQHHRRQGSAVSVASSTGGTKQAPTLQRHDGVSNHITRITHMHASGHIEVSSQEAERLKLSEVSRLMSERKLVLVLDLDHTLLNSVRISDVSQDEVVHLERIMASEADSPKRLLYCLRDKNLWTKLRPFVHELLEELKDLYELHIYTMGDKQYAAEIRGILDPRGRMFTSVISQNDSTSSMAKHLDVALVHEKMVIILDDTEQVWPQHGRNLIKVERYHFFPASLRQWQVSFKSLLEQDQDESSSHGMLATCLRVLKKVHNDFYQQAESSSSRSAEEGGMPLTVHDVRYFLGRERESTLKGCQLVFSHCWPQALSTPFTHPLWKMAEALGGDCTTSYDPQVTTHVVAGNASTEKVLKALSDGKLVVGPEWLQACFFRWERLDESNFAPSTVSGKARSSVVEMHAVEDSSKALQQALQSAGGRSSFSRNG